MTSRARRALVAALAAAGLAVIGVATVVVIGDGGREAQADPAAAGIDQLLGRCGRELDPGASRACYARALADVVSHRRDPRPALQQLADSAWRDGGFLLPNCHGLMHTVGREYALGHGVTLETLMNYLPRSNDPGCSAGFAHGLVSGVAPQIDVRRPRAAASVCSASATRYQRYSCVHGFGHAFMRMHDEELPRALALCDALGPRAAPDCAQGAYHDYWFAVAGVDDTARPVDPETDPRALCGKQPGRYVRACWYRAFVDAQPGAGRVRTGYDLERLCAGLAGLQRAACITGASVIGPPDPAAQLVVCSEVVGLDAESCIRGLKVQNLLNEPPAALVDLIARCTGLRAGAASACRRWLGKVSAVLTDGEFERSGCPRLDSPRSRAECVAGARTMEEALVTFS